ncbi:MAG: sulfotransferase [Phycisphaerales bacterium]|jgi:hypothetical protein
MPPSEPPAVVIERLIAARRWDEAMAASDRACSADRGSPTGWLGRAKINHLRGLNRQALEDIEQALRRSPSMPMALHLKASIMYRLGRGAEAIESMQRLVRSGAPNAQSVMLTLAEALERMGRIDELRVLFDGPWAWQDHPHAVALHLRMLGHSDPAGAIERMQSFARGAAPAPLRRMAGFDAVRLLDRLGRYEEAMQEAVATHASTTPPFDLASFRKPLDAQVRMLAGDAPRRPPLTAPVTASAMVIALPRSGTTLLEQMLDRHPAISGIGEYEGIRQMGSALEARLAWPSGLWGLPRDEATLLQERYVGGARATLRPGSTWTFDKTLHGWQWLPAIGALLPGMVCFEIERDPRDTAISILLSNFNPNSNAWTSSLHSIREVMTIQRELVARGLEALDLTCERLVYEDLVADPKGHAERCLARMGLEMAPEVLQPEANQRAVLTLSNAQVRKPINSASIGRWKNYEFAFDGSWKALDEAHAGRRRS